MNNTFRIAIFFFLFIYNSFPQSLNSKLDKLLQDEFFNSCLISIQVADLTAKEIIYSKNEKMLLRPASNMKIITSAAALIFLGSEYEFHTSLYYDGIIQNGTLTGNLYLVGGCDPDFTTKDLYYFIDTLKSMGVKNISGNIYADISFKDSLYWGKGWMWDDDPSFDAPYLSALNINDNCVEVITNNNPDKARPEVILNPVTKYVSVKNYSSFSGDEKFEITRDWMHHTNEIVVKGKFPESQKSVSEFVNVLEPEKYFLKVFSEVLDSNSIKLNGIVDLKNIPLYAKQICTFRRPFNDVIDNLNKTSDNLSAEMTLYALAEKYSGKPATADSGIQFVNQMIDSLGLNHEDYRIVDGSGVSHYNVVSAELLVKLLSFLYNKYPNEYKLLYNSFPVAGVDGTLENRMTKTAASNNVHAKTGTLTGVSCLSGYLTASNGNQLAFSIMMQNFVGSSLKARRFQDEICKILTEYKIK